jgi:glycosyltransferase involved in cell wall biosynthesis
MSIHVFTSVTTNYLPKARVLAQSVKRHLPDCVFHLVIADRLPLDFELRNEPFDSLMRIEELGIPNAKQWIFQHSIVEACTGVKGFALQRLLARKDCDIVLYFDPDIVVLHSLAALLGCFEHSAVVLTPHLTEPESNQVAIQDNELSALRHGVYNLGFLGVRACAEGRRFADWWANRLEHFCYDDIPRGIFTDQRWVDLAPAYFDTLKILRDPGYNVCTWNLTHRRIAGSVPDGLTVNGQPLYFYHFSGLDSGAQKAMLDRYGSEMPALYQLRDWYLAECDRLGQRQSENISWIYDFFDNGERITSLHRKLYRERADLRKAFPNPFSSRNNSRSYGHWFEINEGNETPDAAVDPPTGMVRKMEAPVGKQHAPTQALDYRIYLSVCGSEPISEAGLDAAVFAKDLLNITYQRANLHLVGPSSRLELLRQSGPPASSLASLAVPEDASHEDAFIAIVKECRGEWDFIFLTADVVLPDLWDLRLAWSAERMGGVATVSPINEHSAYTRLGIAPLHDGVDQIDRACYWYSLRRNPEIPEFLTDCFYVKREAVADVLRSGKSLNTFREFGEACRRFRWSHALADHMYTGTIKEPGQNPSLLVGPLEQELANQVNDVVAGKIQSPLKSVRKHARARQLHMIHSWGGGLERWVSDYCHADRTRTNLVLKAVDAGDSCGVELHLYENIDDPSPIRQWALSPRIKHTAITHSGYQACLSEIVDRYGIDNILISSLIGHSLDALEAGVPAALIAHDFYPFCPALNITFGSVCHRCNESDLRCCTENNVHHRFFRNGPPGEWMELRKAFSQRVLRGRVPIIAPSPSVARHYAELAPELNGCFELIPHGLRKFEGAPLRLDYTAGKRLRIVMMGSIAPQKGLDLFKKIQARVRSFADLFLVGCGGYGYEFDGLKHLIVIPEYDWQELPGVLQSIRPDPGLLLSVVPETFSYTLQELMNLGIPPVATRIGSFADRIEDGVNGFLCDIEPAAVIARLEELNAQRDQLAGVHKYLSGLKQRGVQEMVADYDRVLGLPALSARAYFNPGEHELSTGKGSVDFRLSWRLGSGNFGESARGHRASDGTGTQTMRITIPELGAGPVQLRLDFGHEARFVVLFHVHLYSWEGQQLWSWDSRQGAPGGVWENIQPTALDPGLLLYLATTGSHWLLPVGDAALNALSRGGHLVIEFSRPSVETLISSVSSLVSANQTGEIVEDQRDMLRHLILSLGSAGKRSVRGTSSERVLQRLTDAKVRVRELEASLSWRITAPLRWAGTQALRFTRRVRDGVPK